MPHESTIARLTNRVLAIAIAAIFLSVGCTANPRPGLAYGVIRAWNSTIGGQVHESESFIVPATAVMNVEVDSFAGNVVLHAAGEGATASITVVRRAMHGLTRHGESADSLAQISVSYGVEERDGRTTLVVKTTTTHVEPWFQAVDIDIALPRLGVAVVRTSHGHVIISEFEDGVDIETTKGDVRAVTSFVIHLPSTILNKEGAIDWRVPPGSSGLYEMEAVNGVVKARVQDGIWLLTDRRNDHDSMYGTLNAGTNLVILRTADGDIAAFVGEKPSWFGTFID